MIRKLIYGALMGLVIGVCGCNDEPGGALLKAPKDPPIAVMVRGGFFSDLVMQVYNLGVDCGLDCDLYVRNEVDSKKVRLIVPANGRTEIGKLECGWPFAPGDRGFVSVTNYKRKLFFKIVDGGYETWFGNDDIEAVDVAKIVETTQRLALAQQQQELLKHYVDNARTIYQAITVANQKRATAGQTSLWPTCVKTKMEQMKEMAQNVIRDISKEAVVDFEARKYLNATDYFNDLLDSVRAGGDTHSPFLELELKTVCDANYEHEAGKTVPKEHIQWCILADYDDMLPDWFPVLLSVNVPCEQLGWDKEEMEIQLNPVGELKDCGAVIVCKNGEVKVIPQGIFKPDALYGLVTRQDVGEALRGRTIRYLTPTGVLTIGEAK